MIARDALKCANAIENTNKGIAMENHASSSISAELIVETVKRFQKVISWYNAFEDIDAICRRATMDGAEIICVEAEPNIQYQELIAYTLVHELDKLNEFDSERLTSFMNHLDPQQIALADFQNEFRQVTQNTFAFASLPITQIKNVWQLFDPESLAPHRNRDLPLGWYVGEGEGFKFCALWHDT